jgi:hypothetical protein
MYIQLHQSIIAHTDNLVDILHIHSEAAVDTGNVAAVAYAAAAVLQILHTAVAVAVAAAAVAKVVVEAEVYQVPVAEEEYDTNYTHNSAAVVEHAAVAAPAATSSTMPVPAPDQVH